MPASASQDSRYDENPRRPATILVRLVIEVMSGLRPSYHLETWASPSQRAAVERCQGHFGLGRTTVRSVRVGEPQAGIAEVTAVVDHDNRVTAIALRLERRSGRWRMTAFLVLP